MFYWDKKDLGTVAKKYISLNIEMTDSERIKYVSWKRKREERVKRMQEKGEAKYGMYKIGKYGWQS